MNLKCGLGFHDLQFSHKESITYNIWRCSRCPKTTRIVSDEVRATFKHYCPICHKLEEDCNDMSHG